MKNLYLLFCVAITFSACSKKSAPKPTFVTINGTNYNIVTIGGLTWTSVNYNGNGGVNFNNGANDPVMGKLYTIAEAQAIALPSGWRLPTETDYNDLLSWLGGNLTSVGDYYVSTDTGLALMSTTGWITTNGNNEIGFNAQPAGFYQDYSSQFLYGGADAFFLINYPGTSVPNPLNFVVSANQTVVGLFSKGTNNRASLRFVKNN